MIKASASELQLHFSLLECNKNSLSVLTKHYSEHLLGCLHNWYGDSLMNDPTLAYEAVYQSLRSYSEHPRKFNPEHGSLIRSLELNCDRTMQLIFEREKCHVHHKSIDQYLARHFDNERDVELARLLLKNNNDHSAFVNVLDIGSYRIAQQLVEISRHSGRIKKILNANQNKLFTPRRVPKYRHVPVRTLVPNA
jgi:hypothetical protein